MPDTRACANPLTGTFPFVQPLFPCSEECFHLGWMEKLGTKETQCSESCRTSTFSDGAIDEYYEVHESDVGW